MSREKQVHNGHIQGFIESGKYMGFRADLPVLREHDEGGLSMNYKAEIIKMVLSMKNEDYLFKTYHYLLAKYRREKGGEKS